MVRFFLVALAVFGCLFGSMWLAQPVQAQLKPTARGALVTGEWTGKYVCAQGITKLDLKIAQGAGEEIIATFSFGPLPENPNVPRGAYQMKGRYNPATRRVALKGDHWIDAPDGYMMVGLDGFMEASGGRITGFVPDMSNCSSFAVSRPAELIS